MPATSAVRLPGFQLSRFPGAPSPPPSEGTPRRARDTPAGGPRRAPSRPGVGTCGALGGGAWLP